MKVPLTIADHLERAEAVYGEPVRSCSTSPTSRRMPCDARAAEMVTAPEPRPLRSTISASARGSGWRSSARTRRGCSPRSSGWAARASARADQLPPQRRRDPVHRWSTRQVASMLLVDPELDEASRRTIEAPSTATSSVPRATRCSTAWASNRSRGRALYEDATATINYTSGTTARPKGVEPTHRNLWVNSVTFVLASGGRRS